MYVCGLVIPVPEDRMEAYRPHRPIFAMKAEDL